MSGNGGRTRRVRSVAVFGALALGAVACGEPAALDVAQGSVSLDELFAGDSGGQAEFGEDGAAPASGTGVPGEDGGLGAGDPGTGDGGGLVPGGDPAGPGDGRATPGRRPGASGGGASPRQVPSGKGVSATEVKVGIQASKELGAGFALVGASGEAPSERRIAEALVKWVN
ncbi:MAG TPA: hypothetical protein VNU01_09495, partial [Egibacteraceae bacterium]|nr:hypothetical protein [Egibacteraceae bacterium]